MQWEDISATEGFREDEGGRGHAARGVDADQGGGRLRRHQGAGGQVRRALRTQSARRGGGQRREVERSQLLVRNQCGVEREVRRGGQGDGREYQLSARLCEAAVGVRRAVRGTIGHFMAARLHPAPERYREMVGLRSLSARDLESLLEEECHAWQNEMEWDFEKSADLVRRFVDMRALSGSALMSTN